MTVKTRRLFALGSNGSGQLGVGHVEDLSEPSEVLRGVESDVIDVVSGGNHTAFLQKDGTVWTTGANTDGRCLRTNNGDHAEMFNEPSRATDSVLTTHKILQVAATWEATFLLADDGIIYSAGSGHFGELGLGSGKTITTSATPIRDFPPIDTQVVAIAACMAHVVVVLSNGEVWGWGAGRKGQLAEPSENVWVPRRFTSVPFAARHVACGKDFTCVFGAPDSGDFVIFGLHRNDRFNIRADAPIHLAHWKRIGATWGSVVILTQDRDIVSWGRNDHGQLPPSDLPPLKDFAAGSEHCVGITEDGRVLAFGWGEHGNCGMPVDVSGDVKGRWNQLAQTYTEVRVFAGCATTFYSVVDDHTDGSVT